VCRLSGEAGSDRLREIGESLSGLERAERIEALLDLAGRFREVDPAIARRPFAEERRVPACESQAYVFSEPLPDGTLRFHFAVENPQGLSARAFAMLLDRAYSGAPLEEVARSAEDPPAVIASIFGPELSLGKQLGLSGMLLSVAREAKAFSASRSHLPSRVGA
jgi:cysteine desulfuration protein SufE